MSVASKEETGILSMAAYQRYLTVEIAINGQDPVLIFQKDNGFPRTLQCNLFIIRLMKGFPQGFSCQRKGMLEQSHAEFRTQHPLHRPVKDSHICFSFLKQLL